MTKAQAGGLAVYHVVVKIDPHCAMPIAGRQLIHNALGSVGELLAVRPDVKSPAASKQVEFVLASAQTVEQIAAKCKHSDHCRRSDGRVAAGAAAGSAEGRQTEQPGRRWKPLAIRTRSRPRPQGERAGSLQLPAAPGTARAPRRKMYCASMPAASTTC